MFDYTLPVHFVIRYHTTRVSHLKVLISFIFTIFITASITIVFHFSVVCLLLYLLNLSYSSSSYHCSGKAASYFGGIASNMAVAYDDYFPFPCIRRAFLLIP